MPPDDMKAVLEFARQRGIWIIADEIYGRFCFGGTTKARLADPSRRPSTA
jgi:aspartate aminotransferase